MPTLKALVVEDVPSARQDLVDLLKAYCPEVQVAGFVHHASQILPMVREIRPEVLFLDLSLQGVQAWDILERTDLSDTQIIVVTGNPKITKEAVRPETIAYLTKPVDPAELIRAVQRAAKGRSGKEASNTPDTLRIVNRHGTHLVEISKVVKLVAHNNRTRVYADHLTEPVETSKTLKTFGFLEDSSGFCRIHHSHLINLRHVVRYQNMDGGLVSLSDGSTLSISRSYMPKFLDKIEARAGKH